MPKIQIHCTKPSHFLAGFLVFVNFKVLYCTAVATQLPSPHPSLAFQAIRIMEDYNKVIESLGVRYIKAKNLVLHQPFTVRNSYDVGNNLILLHKGRLTFGEDEMVVEEGEMLFIPGGRPTRVSYGEDLKNRVITNDDLIANKDKFFTSNDNLDLIGEANESHSFVSFEAKVFDSVNFFT